MSELTIQQKQSIDAYRKTHNQYILNDEAVISLMQKEMSTTDVVYKGFENLALKKEGAEIKANSAFDKGFADTQGVIPEWQTKTEPKFKPVEKEAVEFLKDMTASADNEIKSQDRQEGIFSRAFNASKELFNTENAKSNVDNAIKDTLQDVYRLESAAKGELKDWTGEEHTFEEVFKQQRGVEFNEQNISKCSEKANEMAGVQAQKDAVDRLKTILSSSTVNNASNSGLLDANNSIKNAFRYLGVKKQADINNILHNISEKYKDDPIVQKYGGDFAISKNKAGKYLIYRTDKSGFRSEATMEELQIIAKEMKFMVNKAFGYSIGADIPENVSPEELEKITADKYNEHKNEYETAFKAAYGKKDLKTLSENYVMSQKQGEAYIEMSINMLSMATMFMGSGLVLKGAQTGARVMQAAGAASKAEKVVAGVAKATAFAEKAAPILMANQVAQPVKLIENLTAEEPNWKEYGMSVAEGSMWMALGMASGAVGDKARLFLKQKGLSNIVKNSGKSIDEIMTLYKNGEKVTDNLAKAFLKMEKIATASGSGLEFTADVVLTYAANKALHGEDLSGQDLLMSLNGVVLGAVMQNKALKMKDADRTKFIQSELMKDNPKISKTDLEIKTKTLLELSKLAEKKYGKKLDIPNELEEVVVKPEKKIKERKSKILEDGIKDTELTEEASFAQRKAPDNADVVEIRTTEFEEDGIKYKMNNNPLDKRNKVTTVGISEVSNTVDDLMKNELKGLDKYNKKYLTKYLNDHPEIPVEQIGRISQYMPRDKFLKLFTYSYIYEKIDFTKFAENTETLSKFLKDEDWFGKFIKPDISYDGRNLPERLNDDLIDKLMNIEPERFKEMIEDYKSYSISIQRQIIQNNSLAIFKDYPKETVENLKYFSSLGDKFNNNYRLITFKDLPKDKMEILKKNIDFVKDFSERTGYRKEYIDNLPGYIKSYDNDCADFYNKALTELPENKRTNLILNQIVRFGSYNSDNKIIDFIKGLPDDVMKEISDLEQNRQHYQYHQFSLGNLIWKFTSSNPEEKVQIINNLKVLEAYPNILYNDRYFSLQKLDDIFRLPKETTEMMLEFAKYADPAVINKLDSNFTGVSPESVELAKLHKELPKEFMDFLVEKYNQNPRGEWDNNSQRYKPAILYNLNKPDLEVEHFKDVVKFINKHNGKVSNKLLRRFYDGTYKNMDDTTVSFLGKLDFEKLNYLFEQRYDEIREKLSQLPDDKKDEILSKITNTLNQRDAELDVHTVVKDNIAIFEELTSAQIECIPDVVLKATLGDRYLNEHVIPTAKIVEPKLAKALGKEYYEVLVDYNTQNPKFKTAVNLLNKLPDETLTKISPDVLSDLIKEAANFSDAVFEPSNIKALTEKCEALVKLGMSHDAALTLIKKCRLSGENGYSDYRFDMDDLNFILDKTGDLIKNGINENDAANIVSKFNQSFKTSVSSTEPFADKLMSSAKRMHQSGIADKYIANIISSMKKFINDEFDVENISNYTDAVIKMKDHISHKEMSNLLFHLRGYDKSPKPEVIKLLSDKAVYMAKQGVLDEDISCLLGKLRDNEGKVSENMDAYIASAIKLKDEYRGDFRLVYNNSFNYFKNTVDNLQIEQMTDMALKLGKGGINKYNVPDIFHLFANGDKVYNHARAEKVSDMALALHKEGIRYNNSNLDELIHSLERGDKTLNLDVLPDFTRHVIDFKNRGFENSSRNKLIELYKNYDGSIDNKKYNTLISVLDTLAENEVGPRAIEKFIGYISNEDGTLNFDTLPQFASHYIDFKKRQVDNYFPDLIEMFKNTDGSIDKERYNAVIKNLDLLEENNIPYDAVFSVLSNYKYIGSRITTADFEKVALTMVNAAKIGFESKFVINLLSEQIRNSGKNLNVFALFTDDTLRVITSLKDKGCSEKDIKNLILIIANNGRIDGLQYKQKMSALSAITLMGVKERTILKSQNIDVTILQEKLSSSFGQKRDIIKTPIQNQREFLKVFANRSEKAEEGLKTADFSKYKENGIPLKYTREQFIADMNKLIEEAEIKYSDNEAPVKLKSIELSENDLKDTAQFIQTLKSSKKSENVNLVIDGKTVKGIRYHDTQKGSNAAYYTQVDDKIYYVKYPKEENLGQNVEEILASQLYRLAGTESANLKPVTENGKIVAVASEYIPKLEESLPPQVCQDFAADAWLANWDTLLNGNTLMKDGKPVKVDVGGSLHYRARGALKNDFDFIVSELSTLIEKNRTFTNMTRDDLIGSLSKVADISDASIKAMVEKYPVKDAAELTTTLVKRRQYIEKFLSNVKSNAQTEGTSILEYVRNMQDLTTSAFDKKLSLENMFGYKRSNYGFEGLLNNKTLDDVNLSPAEQKTAQKMRDLINRFTLENEVAPDADMDAQTRELLNGLIKGLPEFTTLIGKKQHKVHNTTLDVHILNVLQDAMKDPLYETLSDKDKTILKFSAILHDVGKRYLGDGISDHGHAELSADYTLSILQKFNLPADVKDRIVDIVENHHWFKEYCNGRMTAQEVVVKCRRPEDLKIYTILAKSDFANVNKSFHYNASGLPVVDEKFSADYNRYIEDKVEPLYQGLSSVQVKANLVFDTKFTLANKKFPAEKAMINGEEAELKVLNLTSMDAEQSLQPYGFAPGVTRNSARFMVHMVPVGDYSMETTYNLLSSTTNKSVWSTSLVKYENKNTYCDRCFGFVFDIDQPNISEAYFGNTGSGTKKSTNKFEKILFEDAGVSRMFVKDNFIKELSSKGIELTKEEYIEIVKQLSNKKYITSIKDIKVGDRVLKASDVIEALENSRDKLFEGKQHSEIVPINPRIKAVIAKTNSLNECEPAFLEFAKKNNLPVILIGNSVQ